MVTFVIRPIAPYDFSLMVRRLKGVKHEAFRFEENTNTLSRTIRTKNSVYLAQIRSVGSTEAPELEVRLSGTHPPGPEESSELRTKLTRMLSATVNLKPFYEHMASIGPEMQALTERFRGLHLLTEADLFECMCKTIIGQQLNLSFASELTRRLMRTAAEPFLADGVEYPVFPSPEDIAALEYEQLQTLQFSRRKAEYVIDWACKMKDGTVDRDSLYEKSDDQIMTELLPLRGIGRWTVECFLLFGLGRTNLLPAADIGVRNALKKLYGLDVQPSEQDVRTLGASWSPWSSYVSLYLWESLHEWEGEKL